MTKRSHPPLSSSSRRTLLALSVAFLAGCRGSAPRLEQAPRPPLSAENEALKRKFRRLEGGQLRVDSLFIVRGLNIFDEHGWLFFAAASMSPPAVTSSVAIARSLACRSSCGWSGGTATSPRTIRRNLGRQVM